MGIQLDEEVHCHTFLRHNTQAVSTDTSMLFEGKSKSALDWL